MGAPGTGRIPEVRLGKYELLDRIAVGGMAELWRARFVPAIGIEKVLAVKRVLPQLAVDPEFVSLFREEAKLSLGLAHPNVVQVFDFGEEGDELYLAMELVDGRDLRRVLRRSKELEQPLPVPWSLLVGSEVARGLGYAHARADSAGRPLGLVHRDVSPSNILISWEGEVKVTDFGIAKAATAASLTRSGTVRGKAAYLSPEQAAGEPLDGRSDLFALGLVLWELLVGRRLYGGGSEAETMQQVLSGRAAPPPSTQNPMVRPEVDRLVLSLLDRDRERRPPEAAAVAKSLRSLAGSIGPAEIGELMRSMFAREIEAGRTAAPPPAPATPLPSDPGRAVEVLPDAERRKLF